jgi:hypothetical protein
MPISTVKVYTRQLLLSNKDKFFVFGDNLVRRGLGGQANVCRGHPNTIGIVTKRFPNNYFGSFYYERNYDEWLRDSASGFHAVEHELKKKVTIVWPADGIGTGLAELPKNAPSIHRHIEEFLKRMKETYGEDITP